MMRRAKRARTLVAILAREHREQDMQFSVRPEPFDSVRPELVEGTNGTQDRLVEG